MTSAGFAVIQPGYAIFGTGATQDEAWKDAEEWADTNEENWKEDLECWPASAALIAAVRDPDGHGGKTVYKRVDGALCTVAEAEG